MTLSNLKISRKLALAFASVILSLVGMAALVFVSLDDIRIASAQNDHAAHVLNIVDHLTEVMLDYSGQIRGYLLTHDHDFVKGVADDKDRLKGLLDQLRGAVTVPALEARIETIAQAIADYNTKAGDPEMRLGRNPATMDQALGVIKSGANKAGMNAFKVAAKDFSDNEITLLDQRMAARDAAIQSSQQVLIIGALIAFAIAGIMGWLLSSQIANPIAAMTAAMRRLASGDHNIDVPAVGRADEVGLMAAAVHTFKAAAVEKLQLEQDASAARAQTEEERQNNEAIRAKAAEEQARAMERLADGLKRLADGDLTSRLDDGFAESYAQIRDDFNEALAKLNETMLSVVSSTNAINTGTREISTAADDLSKRTEQQAASLEETGAALEEITATVKKSADGASHAREAVAAADEDAKQSSVVVRKAVEAMDAIARSSGQIGQIIGVIDEIAFQTNLLALNAGVEAARAGDAGRGFAVVASEVRALAQRSAEAAKQIKGLITESSGHVDEGVRLVGETGTSLERIMAQVSEINGIITKIASGAQEQATGLAQVNTAINQMDQATQQNAAMVEESTAASHSLSHETVQLADQIAQFRVGGQDQSGTIRHEHKMGAPRATQKPKVGATASQRRAAASPVRAVVNGGLMSDTAQWKEF